MTKKHVCYEIRFTARSGEEAIHRYSGSDAGAEGWAKALAQDYDCKAVAEEVFDDGTRRHVASHGDRR